MYHKSYILTMSHLDQTRTSKCVISSDKIELDLSIIEESSLTFLLSRNDMRSSDEQS